MQRLGDTPGVTDIAASGKATLGPLDTDMRYQVECLLGSLTYSVSKDEFGVTVVPKTADHTFAIDDANSLLRFNSGSDLTATVPTNAFVGFEIGTQIAVERAGSGALTIAGADGVTINTSTTLTLAAQFSIGLLIKVDTDEWTLTGDLTLP